MLESKPTVHILQLKNLTVLGIVTDAFNAFMLDAVHVCCFKETAGSRLPVMLLTAHFGAVHTIK